MTPKLRFQEFEDSWSQVTIAEAASFRRGSFPQPYNIPQWYDDVNGMPFVQVVDVGNDFRLKPKTKQMISELAMPKSVFVIDTLKQCLKANKFNFTNQYL